jgi:hypothetical protein
MAVVTAPPNFERAGIVAGFVLAVGSALTPTITKGALFAQGALYRPAAAPVLPPAPASRQSWLHYNSVGGFYWSQQPAPNVADDVGPIGWVVTDATNVVAVSRQEFRVPDPESNVTVVEIGSVLDQGPGTGIQTYGDTGLAALSQVPLSEFQPGLQQKRPGGVFIYPPALASQPGNRASISAAYIRVSYVDEIEGQSSALASAVDNQQTEMVFANPDLFQVGDLVFLDDGSYTGGYGPEVVTLVSRNGALWTVTRGSGADAHAAGCTAYRLKSKVLNRTFTPPFWSSADSAFWFDWEDWPFVRIVLAESWVTNAFGDSVHGLQQFDGYFGQDGVIVGGVFQPFAGFRFGLRTYLGSELLIQVDGTLGIEASPAPPLVVPAAASCRDISARVNVAPTGADLVVTVLRNGQAYATVTIPAGATVSNFVSGASLSPLLGGDILNVDVTAVGTTYPGADLSVVVRL